MGTSLLLYASFLVVVYLATQRFSWVVLGLALFALGALPRTRCSPMSGFACRLGPDPFADPDNTGDQIVQSLFGFATGGIFGTGLGNGQPEHRACCGNRFHHRGVR